MVPISTWLRAEADANQHSTSPWHKLKLEPNTVMSKHDNKKARTGMHLTLEKMHRYINKIKFNSKSTACNYLWEWNALVTQSYRVKKKKSNNCVMANQNSAFQLSNAQVRKLWSHSRWSLRRAIIICKLENPPLLFTKQLIRRAMTIITRQWRSKPVRVSVSVVLTQYIFLSTLQVAQNL